MIKKIKKKVAIVGAGASGLASAILLKRQGIEVEVFEKEKDSLKKLAATGNGRCNFTNVNIGKDNYIGDEKLVDIAIKFTYEDDIDFFASLGVLSQRLESGRVYPSSMSGASIIFSLKNEAKDLDIKIHQDVEIRKIEKKGDFFHLYGDRDYFFDLVVLATGGREGIRKKTFSNGYELAKSFGHSISPISYGICPLEIVEIEAVKDLAKIKQKAKLTLLVEGEEKASYIDDLLFTDYGISGTSVFQLSNKAIFFANKNLDVKFSIDLMPDYNRDFLVNHIENNLRKSRKKTLADIISSFLDVRIGENIARRIHSEKKAGKNYDKRDIIRAVDLIKMGVLTYKSPRKGQISQGGVKADEIKTSLESKLVPNLFFTGELIDVQGDCGGYNLHWAWASAHKCSESILKKISLV